MNTVGLKEAQIRQYIKNQREEESIESRYDTDFVKAPFRGASSILDIDDSTIR